MKPPSLLFLSFLAASMLACHDRHEAADAMSDPVDAMDDVVGDTAPSGDGAIDPALQGFCQQITATYYQGVCAYYQRCCNATEQMDPTVSDQLTACADTRGAIGDCVAQLHDAIGSGRTQFAADGMAACVAAITAVLPLPTQCNALNDLAQAVAGFNAFALPACQAVAHGTLSTGNECVDGFECQSGFCAPGTSQDDGGVTPGRCVATPTVGSDCSGGQPCAFGASCVAGACRAAGATGAACSFDGDCQVGLDCAMDADAGTGTCAARADLGGDCADATGCHSGVCDAAGHCASYCSGSAASTDAGTDAAVIDAGP